MRYLRSAAAFLLLAAPAWSTTWIVDDDGGAGVHFTSIAAALAAAAPGDVLLVHPGTYGGFTVSANVVIVGVTGGVNVTGHVVVQAIPSGTRAALAGLDLAPFRDLTISGSPGAVLVDACTVPGGSVRVIGCADVRLRGVTVAGRAGFPGTTLGGGDGFDALFVEASRVEVVESDLRGGRGGDCLFCQTDSGYGGYGGHGIRVEDASSVHAARTYARGGDGGNASTGFLFVGAYGGDGGDGVFVGGGSVLLVSGLPTHTIQHGAAGTASGLGAVNGSAGRGVQGTSGTTARISGASVSSIADLVPEFPSPADPAMNLIDVPVPGGPATFRITGPPGSTVQIVLGRRPEIVPTPGLQEDVLVLPGRTFNLGTIDGTGVKSVLFHLPATLPEGYTLVAQSVLTFPDASLRRTHSIPLIVR